MKHADVKLSFAYLLTFFFFFGYLLEQSLALAHADVDPDNGKVVFVPWVETDFRTGENPWWA